MIAFEVKVPDWNVWPAYVQEDVRVDIYASALYIAHKLGLNVNISLGNVVRHNLKIMHPNNYGDALFKDYGIKINQITKLEILNRFID